MKMRIAVVIFVMLVPALAATASPKSDKERCQEVKERIREIEARMRIGYSASQGIRLEARLRKLKDERYRLCR